MTTKVSCPDCLSRLADAAEYVHGNIGAVSMGHQMFHTPSGPAALCILPRRCYTLEFDFSDPDAAENGYYWEAYFTEKMPGSFPTRKDAADWAMDHYKGADQHGVDCTWEVVEIDY